MTLASARLKASVRFPPLRGMYQRGGTCKGCDMVQAAAVYILISGIQILALGSTGEHSQQYDGRVVYCVVTDPAPSQRHDKIGMMTARHRDGSCRYHDGGGKWGNFTVT